MEAEQNALDKLKHYLYSLGGRMPHSNSLKKTVVNVVLAVTLSFTGAAVACAPKNIKPEVVSPPPIVQQNTENQTTNYEKNRKEFEALLPTMDKTFADWVTKSKFTQEDGTISDDELKVLKEPKNEQYVLQLFDDYISEVNGVNPDLAFELKRLPEIKEKVEAKTLDVKDLEPLEDIVVAAQNPKYKKGFEGMLNEGIRDKIKLNTSIEVLYEGLFSQEIDENFAPLLNYSVYNLYTIWFGKRFSKEVSEEYQNFNKKMTEDFEFFTDRMISPNWIAWAIWWKFEYGGLKQMQDNLTPQECFKSKVGNCVDYTAFAVYCLRRHGYDNAHGLLVSLNRPLTTYYNVTSHASPIFLNPKDNLLYVLELPTHDITYKHGENWWTGPNMWSYIDEYYQSKTGVYGPYSSEQEAANDINRIILGDKSKATSYQIYNFDMATGKFK
jgi:hypothetical protein